MFGWCFSDFQSFCWYSNAFQFHYFEVFAFLNSYYWSSSFLELAAAIVRDRKTNNPAWVRVQRNTHTHSHIHSDTYTTTWQENTGHWGPSKRLNLLRDTSSLPVWSTVVKRFFVRSWNGRKNLIGTSKRAREREREKRNIASEREREREIQTKEREAEEGYTAPFIVLKWENQTNKNTKKKEKEARKKK